MIRKVASQEAKAEKIFAKTNAKVQLKTADTDDGASFYSNPELEPNDLQGNTLLKYRQSTPPLSRPYTSSRFNFRPFSNTHHRKTSDNQ